MTADRSFTVQRRALEALARLDMPRAIPIAEKLALASNLQLSLAAISVLTQGDKDRAVPVLKRKIESGVELEKGFALRTLHAFKHPDAEPLARKLLKDDTESVKLVALSVLVEQGVEDALERTLEFVPQTQHLTSYVAWLVEQHYTDPKFIPRFAAELKKGDIKCRMLAAIWLGYFAGPESRDALLPGLEDPDPRIRVIVAMALARNGEREKIVPVLLELSKNPEIRESGELWVGLGLTRDARVKDVLLQAIQSPAPERSTMPFKAMEGLGLFGDASTLPLIRKYFFSRSDALRDAALFAGARMGDPVAVRRFYRRVEDCLKNPDNTRPGWMGEMIFHLGQIPGDSSMRLLEMVLKGPEAALKMKAVSALQEIGTMEAVEHLNSALEDYSSVGGQYSPQRSVREVALKSLIVLTHKRLLGTIDEQIAAWRKWWQAEGKASYKKS
jgi:HEAT repeat protein